MNDLAQTAESLRDVRVAADYFLGLWALECLIEEARVIEKLSADLRDHDPGAGGFSEAAGRSIL